MSKATIRIPPGFQDLLEGLAREVLRKQPDDIYAFSAEYFEKIIRQRQVDLSEEEESIKEKKYLDQSPSPDKEQGCDPALKEKDAQDDKRPIKKPTESGEDEKEREDAALKIQTKYRQCQAKKTVQQLKDDRGKSPNSPDESQESESDKPQSPTFDAHDPKLNEAATRVQAGVKGYLTRKELQTIKEEKKAKEADVSNSKGAKVIEEAKNIKEHGQSSLLGFQHQITSQLSDLQKQAEATKAELNQQIHAKATQMQESAKLAREQAEAKAAEAKQAAEAKALEAKIAAEAKALELKTTAEDAKKTAEANVEEAKQTIESKAEETKQIVGAKVEEAKHSAEQAKQAVETKVQETKQTVNAKLEEAKQAKEAKETEIKQAVETTAANAKQSINEVIADSEAKIDEIKEASESNISEIKKSADETADLVVLKTKEANQVVDSKVTEAVQYVKGTKAATENKVDESLKAFQEVKNSIDESKASIEADRSAEQLEQVTKTAIEEKVSELKQGADAKTEELKGVCDSKLEEIQVMIDAKKIESDSVLNAETKLNENKQTTGGLMDEAKQLIQELQLETTIKAAEVKRCMENLKDSTNNITITEQQIESKIRKEGDGIVDAFQHDVKYLKDQALEVGQITDTSKKQGQTALGTEILTDFNMVDKKVNDLQSKQDLISKKNLNESLQLIDQEMKDFLENGSLEIHDEMEKTRDEVKFDVNGEHFNLKSPEVKGKIDEKYKKVKTSAQQAVAKSELASKGKTTGCFPVLGQEMEAEVVEIKKNIKEKKKRNRKAKEKVCNQVESNAESQISESKNIVSTELLDSYLRLLQEQTENTPLNSKSKSFKLDQNLFLSNVDQDVELKKQNKPYLEQNWDLDSSALKDYNKAKVLNIDYPAAQKAALMNKTVSVEDVPAAQEAALIHIELLETEAELLQTEAELFEAEVERAALTDLGAQFDDSSNMQVRCVPGCLS